MSEEMGEGFDSYEEVEKIPVIGVNSVIQINEKHPWTGCLVQVSSLHSDGVTAFVEIPTQGRAYMRLNKGEYEYIGEAALSPGEHQ